MKNVWSSVGRISSQILRVKGLNKSTERKIGTEIESNSDKGYYTWT